MLTIAYALNEILADYVNTLLAWHNREYGTNLTRDQISEYEFWKFFECSKEESDRRIHEFYETLDFHNMLPVKGAQDGIEKLPEHDTIIITPMSKSIEDKTEAWLNYFFPYKFYEIYYNEEWSKSESNNSKADICSKLEVDILVEHNTQHAEGCADNGIFVILKCCPWNQREELDGVMRLTSWPQIVNKINEYEEKIEINH